MTSTAITSSTGSKNNDDETNRSSSSSSSSSYDDDSSSSSSSSSSIDSNDNNTNFEVQQQSTTLTVHNNYNNNNNIKNTTGINTQQPNLQQPTIDDERQILLLMLLAQVCALHDVTPKTFTVHVLELYERGILDQSSIHFLYDLGLVVVSVPPPQQQQSNNDSIIQQQGQQRPSHITPINTYDQQEQQPLSPKAQLLLQEEGDELTIVAVQQQQQDHQLVQQHYYQKQRSMEASAIRTSLQYHDHQQQQQQQRQRAEHRSSTTATVITTAPSSWSVEEHPLSLSRYQREFKEIQRLASGSFGDVYHVMCYLDSCEYAMKRVLFNATGYSNHTIQQVIREIHCLAKCDHPNVVRYYTSWLEPSWMTGSSSSSTTTTNTTATIDGHHHPNLNADDSTGTESYLKLITDIQSAITIGASYDDESKNLEDITENFLLAYFNDRNSTGNKLKNDSDQKQKTSRTFERNRRKSFSSYGESNNIMDNNVSEYTGNQWDVTKACRDDISIDGYQPRSQRYIDTSTNSPLHVKEKKKSRENDLINPLSYRYQISMYIQMQLCNSITLADYIRSRNEQQQQQQQEQQQVQCNTICIGEQFDMAITIFEQIVNGLRHVHEHNIVHRDLKPSNVFTSCSKTQPNDGILNFKIGDFGLSKLIPTANPDSPSYFQKSRNGQFHPKQQLVLLESPTTSQAIVPPNNGYVPNNRKETTWWDHHHTAGVGTASYAAPEQVVSQTYGTAVDIYSLGLILLELICYFTTEHERLQTFYNCRQQRMVPNELCDQYPVVAQIILSCTEPNAHQRPTAGELCTVNLRSGNSTQMKRGDCTTSLNNSNTIVTDAIGNNSQYTNSVDTTNTSLITLMKHKISEQELKIASLQHQLDSCQLELKQKEELIQQLKLKDNS